MFWKRKRPARVEIYADAANRWRWRSVAANGKIIGAAEQSYASKYYAASKAEKYADHFGLPIVYLTKDEATG